MQCLIVDDEPQARKLLTTYLTGVSGVTVLGACASAVEAYEALQTLPVELMFLDIRMPVLSGLDFLRSLRRPPPVILTTAYPEHALEGYELDVLDYLLKPIALPRLLQSLEKARQRIRQQHEFLFVKVEGKLVNVPFEEIVCVEGLQNYVKLHLRDRFLVAAYSMKAMEDLLPAPRFLRVHRSYILPMSAIRSIQGNVIETPIGDVPIGQNYREALMDIVGKGHSRTG
jgi:DNA-binding LytR/AlgR family response regulator